MSLKKYKPTTPGQRFVQLVDRSDITKQKPEKSLTRKKKQNAGRNNTGRVTCRHRGGGHKRRLREVDFMRAKDGLEAKVVAIEYDPNRSARLALLHYTDGTKAYVLATKNMKVGDRIQSGPGIDVTEGNCLPLRDIPLGSTISNVELNPGRGGKIARSAGIFAQLIAKEGKYAHVRMPSGEVRLIHQSCRATMGQVGNEEHSLQSIGKAGRTRWLGIRPTVRGTVMNPCDHPHGGGEGRNKTSGRHPCSPWGTPAKGGKTRRASASNKFIVTSRKKKKKR
jgi:large subunit ribosomal protein L2